MRKLLCLIAAAASAPVSATSLQGLAHVRRVLVVTAPEAGAPDLIAQDRLLSSKTDALATRDITVVHVVGDVVSGVSDDAAALRRRLGITPDAFAVRLIDKDGHIALRDAQPVTTDRLFATIDAMPMRRDEAARRGR